VPCVSALRTLRFLAALLSSLAVASETAPPQLRCLTQWYDGVVSRHPERGWGLQLSNTHFLPWKSPALADFNADAGVEKTEALAEADVSSMFEVPYVAGPIRPVDASDAGVDPGRTRVESLMLATYGESDSQVSAQLEKVSFFGIRYPFHRRAAPALARVVARLETLTAQSPSLMKFLKPIGGTFVWRRILHSRALSAHAFGIAIDLNVAHSHYWRWRRLVESTTWRNTVPQDIVDAFEAEGFIWGGRWKHYDTMHFEYRPELLSLACQVDALTMSH
jgi:hypothetical protein